MSRLLHKPGCPRFSGAGECDCFNENEITHPCLPDDPEMDATDFAHPAWWRGNDHGVIVLCQKINAILDGKDDGAGVSQEPWNTTRKRLIKLATP